MDQLLVVSILCFLCIVPLSHQQNLDEQIEANSVFVQFDKNYGKLLELDEWNDNDATTKFREVTAIVATTYCMNFTMNCNLLSLDSDFFSGDVMLMEDPIFYNGDIRFGVYISLENKNVNDPDQLVIRKNTLKEILESGTDNYEAGLVNEDTRYNITLMFVDGERIAPPMDYTVNIIMIIVSLLILLAACFLACVLKCKEDMEQKNKLKGVATTQDTHIPGSNDAGENLTLTAIKPAADDDSKEPSEGAVKA